MKKKRKTYIPKNEDEFVSDYKKAKPGDTIDMTQALRDAREKNEKNMPVDLDVQNAIALLDECLTNGDLSPASLYAWFVSERHLIESTLRNIGALNAKD